MPLRVKKCRSLAVVTTMSSSSQDARSDSLVDQPSADRRNDWDPEAANTEWDPLEGWDPTAPIDTSVPITPTPSASAQHETATMPPPLAAPAPAKVPSHPAATPGAVPPPPSVNGGHATPPPISGLNSDTMPPPPTPTRSENIGPSPSPGGFENVQPNGGSEVARPAASPDPEFGRPNPSPSLNSTAQPGVSNASPIDDDINTGRVLTMALISCVVLCVLALLLFALF